jgi:hypothetical protein
MDLGERVAISRFSQRPWRLLVTHLRRLLLPLFGYRGQHRQVPYSKPTPLDHHDGPLLKVVVQPGQVR